MTKEQKIQILKDNIQWKPDIPKALELLDCKVGIEIGVRKAGHLQNLSKNPKFKEGGDGVACNSFFIIKKLNNKY